MVQPAKGLAATFSLLCQAYLNCSPRSQPPFLSHGDGEGVGMRGKTQCLTNVEEQGSLYVYVHTHTEAYIYANTNPSNLENYS